MFTDGAALRRFASLEEMTRFSDAVVIGRVVSVTPWRRTGEHPVYEVARVTVEVEKVFRGSQLGTVEFEQTHTIDGLTPRGPIDQVQIGDRGVFFLVDDVDRGDRSMHGLASYQALYLDTGDALRGSDSRDPLVAQLNTLSLDELATRIENVD